MEILKELVQVITKNKVRNINVLGNQTTSEKVKDSPRVIEFYDKMLEGAFQTDDEAAQYFFGTTAKNQQYKKLKSEFKNRLVNTAFFIDVGQAKYNDYEKAIFTCFKEITAARILLARGARQTGMELIKRVFSQATKFEHPELMMNTARTLRNYYSSKEFDQRKLEHYDQLYLHSSQAWLAENEGERLYIKLIGIYNKNRNNKTLLKNTALNYYNKLLPDLQKYNLYKIQNFGFQIKLIELISSDDYLLAINHCDEALKTLKGKGFVSKSIISGLLHQKLVCHTYLKQYKAGILTANEGLKLEREGSFNWFKNQELASILAFHTQNYQTVYEIYNTVINNKYYKHTITSNQEIWKLIEAFLHYLVFLNKVTPKLSDKRFTKFKLAKFLNEVPSFSKDKRAMNIPVLIIQILFTIGNKKYDQAIDRIEAIEKYCSRYVRKDNNFRSNNFIKMLLQIPNANFNKRGVIRKAQKYKTALESTPIEIANQAHGIEIIPYEVLWNFALDSLRMKNFTSSKWRERKTF